MNIKHDGALTIATAKSRFSTSWRNTEITWSDLLTKLSETTRSKETVKQYEDMSKEEQGKAKDVGGFVGGALKAKGNRKATNIKSRDLLTLDIDHSEPSIDIWEHIKFLNDYACCIYSTHSHREDNPRYRLIIPLSRSISIDEYQAVARMIADDIGIDQFDDTTYEPSRLMYWASTPKNGEFIFKYQDSKWLNPDDILARYTFGWQDMTYWPQSSRETKKIKKSTKGTQQDPTTKKGAIGIFCRAYTIPEAIETFLNDVYIAGSNENRYTYAEGSTSNGLVVYEDGLFCYSNHNTDPISGILCNAFDLVRIHKFGELDESVRSDTKSKNLPSLNKMIEFVNNDKKSQIHKQIEKELSIKEDFDPVMKPVQINQEDEERFEWLMKLKKNEKGNIKSTIDNIVIILENDDLIKGKLAYNEFSLRSDVKGSLPWNDSKKVRHWEDGDCAGLRHYLEKIYEINRAKSIIDDAVTIVFNKNKFHPVKDYLNSLIWDGEKRVETTLIDYFGVEDNLFTRAASRIFICGAVARIFNPGCQLDYITTIVGKQGIRKGTFYRYMAKEDEWFTELATIKYKDAVEETNGKWIVEMAEMAPTRKSEREEMKAFITNKSKTLRLAYAHNPVDIPRQFVLVASTNESNFLKDPTGDRRYLPVDADVDKATKSIVNDLRNEVDQIYAEAIIIYKKLKYKSLMLSKEEEALAETEQENHKITDDEEGTIIKYLNTPLPLDWYEKDIQDRHSYFNDIISPKIETGESFIRNRVCVKEILYELYAVHGKTDLRDSRRINEILQGLKNWGKQKSPINIKGYGLQRGYYRK